MAISDNYQPDITAGNGSTTIFTGSWTPIAASFMRVNLENISTGVLTLQVLDTDYTLSFTSAGYIVTFNTAPSSAYNVIMSREVALTQAVPYTTAKGFQGPNFENSLDKLTAICQDTKDDVGRSLKYQIGSTASTDFPEPEANKVIGWNAGASNLVNLTPNDGAYLNVSTYIETLLDDTTAPDARTTLGAAASGANSDITSLTGLTTALSLPQDFRLTLQSLTPVMTTDGAGGTTIYCTPYRGNQIALFNGTTWQIYATAEFSLVLSGLTSGKPYDVFCYANAGVPTLEFLVWTNDTTRATALAYQNGILCKSGQLTRRYLGTFYTSATTTTEDTAAKRWLWNYYNRVPKFMRVTEATDNWNYTTSAFQQARATATNQLDVVIGVSEDTVSAQVIASASNTNAGVNISVGIGLDSTTALATGVLAAPVSAPVAAYLVSPSASWEGYPGAGRHIITWLERSVATGTTTFYGDNGAPTNLQSGIHGRVFC